MDPDRPLIIGVDFDGTICAPAEYPEVGTPYVNVIETLQQWSQDPRIQIILFTCREGESLAKAVRFLTQNSVVLDAINEPLVQHKYGWGTGKDELNPLRKPYFDVYIDDKSVFMPDVPDWIAINEKIQEMLDQQTWYLRDFEYRGRDNEN